MPDAVGLVHAGDLPLRLAIRTLGGKPRLLGFDTALTFRDLASHGDASRLFGLSLSGIGSQIEHGHQRQPQQEHGRNRHHQRCRRRTPSAELGDMGERSGPPGNNRFVPEKPLQVVGDIFR